MEKIEELSWDSNFFNMKIGKVIFKGDEIAINQFKDFDLIYVFSNKNNLPFRLMDKKIVYTINDLSQIQCDEYTEFDFYNPEIDNYNELLELSYQSGEYSRFKLDDKFKNDEFKKLYKEWLDNSINKKIASHILIKKQDGRIVGFCTFGEKTQGLADIGLLAVDLNYRGKGIAKNLLKSAICLSKELGFNKLQVVTQLDNIPANILYNQLGFKKETLTYIYHIWNHDTI